MDATTNQLSRLINPVSSVTQGYPFQIGYSEPNCITAGASSLPTFTLYLVSPTDKERTEWIRAIRKGKPAPIAIYGPLTDVTPISLGRLLAEVVSLSSGALQDQQMVVL